MPTCTFNDKTIESASVPRKDMRRALRVAEREGLDQAAEKTDVPRPLIQKFCDEADVEPGSGRPSGDGAPATPESGIEFFEPAREAAARQGGAFLSIYKGSAGGFRFSAAAAALMDLEDGDRIVFARDAAEKREHVYLGVKKDGRKPAGGKGAKLNISKSTRGFSSVPLAQSLGISKPEQGRRLIIETEPTEKSGLKLWKAVLQKSSSNDED